MPGSGHFKKGSAHYVKAVGSDTIWCGRLEQLVARCRSTWLLGIIDQLICGVAAFLTGSLIAHASSRSEFGLFSLGASLILLLVDVQAGLISTPQSVHAHGFAPDLMASFSGSTLVHQILLATIASAGLWVFGACLLRTNSATPGLGPVINAIAVFATFLLLREYLRRFFYTHGQFARVVLFDAAIAVAQLSLLCVVSFQNKVSAYLAHALLGAVSALFSVTVLVALRGQFRISRTRIRPDFVKNFEIGKWAVVNNLLWTFGAYAYPWLLVISHGPRTTALWAACMSIIGIMNIVLAGILNVLTPNMARFFAGSTGQEFRSYVFYSCRNYVGIALLLSILPIVFGQALIVRVYGKAYAEAYPVIVILAINAVFGALVGGVGRGLMVAGGAKQDFLINALTVALVFTAGWWATVTYGISGAALSLAFGNVVGGGSRLYAFHRISARSLS